MTGWHHDDQIWDVLAICKLQSTISPCSGECNHEHHGSFTKSLGAEAESQHATKAQRTTKTLAYDRVTQQGSTVIEAFQRLPGCMRGSISSVHDRPLEGATYYQAPLCGGNLLEALWQLDDLSNGNGAALVSESEAAKLGNILKELRTYRLLHINTHYCHRVALHKFHLQLTMQAMSCNACMSRISRFSSKSSAFEYVH